jgi:FAD/FMN-containing dehydrogenase/Fe-S oxidoreductase
MIPKLSNIPNLDATVQAYLTTLREIGFNGDIATHYADRLSLATDNSIYQNLPAAVLFPKSSEDIIKITQLSQETRFQSLLFAPRGGGTGTNGQSLNSGIIIDLSRHMNKIIDLDTEAGWVEVEAGVIKDQLNRYLAPYGYFFAPELSTSNRATIGGMINTDASGQGSLVYGKTSENVLALQAILVNGEQFNTEIMRITEAQHIAEQNNQQGKIYRQLLATCLDKRSEILRRFPKLNRFMTGYDLQHVISNDGQYFDAGRIICGSEGTLALVTSARLRILPLPKVRILFNINYNSFDAALRHAPWLVEAKALSVETIDSTVLQLAQQDIIWPSVASLIEAVPGQQLAGLNIVEFAGQNQSEIQQQVQRLSLRLTQLTETAEAGVIGFQLCEQLEDVERIYAMRKKAVGLLGNVAGFAKPIPFVEDTAVPPECLADYIGEFRALLDEQQLQYGMFGHVDAGVLHVRPAIDLCEPQTMQRIKQLSDAVMTLTQRYGGVIWGEHGKGYRGSYTEAMLGAELFAEQRKLKAVFDKNNRLNPGKICTPTASQDPLLPLDSPIRGDFDQKIPVKIRESWRGALSCNGNGLCFNFDEHTAMCPSMKITANRIHSPKGRATLVREWLRLITEQGCNVNALEQQPATFIQRIRQLPARVRNSWRAKRGDYDFSHEVRAAMDGCLACKACSTQCPIRIDVPSFRSRFMQLYHSRYLRPAGDYLIANIERYSPLLSKTAPLVNRLLKQRTSRQLTEKWFGLTYLPELSIPTLAKRVAAFSLEDSSLARLSKLSPAARARKVLLVQDPFTSFYEAELVYDCLQLISALGYQPLLLPFRANGKAQHVKGFLPEFKRTAEKTASYLNAVAKLDIPMLGIDPAMVLCYRQEYPEVLGAKQCQFKLQLIDEWLISAMPSNLGCDSSNPKQWYLFSHCTERSVLPGAAAAWQAIFARVGATLEPIATGCCGMAGTFGHEVKNQQQSAALFSQSWQMKLDNLPVERCVATGYSCRSQVKRYTEHKMQHPLQALLKILPHPDGEGTE